MVNFTKIKNISHFMLRFHNFIPQKCAPGFYNTLNCITILHSYTKKISLVWQDLFRKLNFLFGTNDIVFRVNKSIFENNEKFNYKKQIDWLVVCYLANIWSN